MKSMKKSVKNFLTIMMALSMMLAMSITALAAPSTVTINKKASDPVTGRTYAAYQVFTGTYDPTTGKLTGIDWGNGVNATDLKAELNNLSYKNAGGTTVTPFSAVKAMATPTATDYADVMTGHSNETNFRLALAEAIEKHLTTTTSGTFDNTTDYTISGLADGYYLILEKTPAGTDKINQDTRTRGLLVVAGEDIEINTKWDLPTIEKKIMEGTEAKDYNQATLGEKVHYRLTSQVPNMDGYDKYYFVVTDTLTDGLDFDIDSVVVKVGMTTLVNNTGYKIEMTDAQHFKIIFKDFIQHKAGEDIVITYDATLNANADNAAIAPSATDGNKNKVKLTYSNDPSYKYEGKYIGDNGTPGDPTDDYDPDQPEDTPGTPGNPHTTPDPVGETPEDIVYTYTTKLKLFKIDGQNKTKKLSGAVFQLTNGNGYDQTLTTDTNGELTFEEIGKGTYTLTEITPPSGYNPLSDPITLVVDYSIDTSGNITWKETKIGDVTYHAASKAIEITVENNPGAVLPATGGIGTTIFYVLGGLLVCGSVVLLITRKRMSMMEK